MIFGAMIVSVGIGLIAMIAAIAAGMGLLSALLIYCATSCIGTAGICVAKVLWCKAGMTQNPPADQSA